MTFVISPQNCPFPEKTGADLVLDGETDIPKLAAECAKPDRVITILAGTINGNGGSIPDGSRYLRPGCDYHRAGRLLYFLKFDLFRRAGVLRSRNVAGDRGR